MILRISQADIDFIRAQLLLPGNDPRNLPGGTVLDPFGIRDVRGVGNNILNPTWGAVDQLFSRVTVDSTPPDAQGSFTFGQQGPVISWTPVSYAQRGLNLVDTTPRTISNLVANQDGGTIFQPTALAEVQVQDDPTTTPGGRVSPLTGADNPLPYSGFMTLFGQFFDHGLDLVHKGKDGMVLVPLLPGDPLYVQGGHSNFMVASRTNTVSVEVGVGSTDSLVAELGLTEGNVFGTVTTTPTAFSSAGGTLVLNGRLITIDPDTSLDAVVTILNEQSLHTNVVASLDTDGKLVLTPRSGESINTISPFIDLSQAYGSDPSHTVFLREYTANGMTTGALVSTQDGGMPTWAIIKANAQNIGITLHDYNVNDIPMVRLNADGTPFMDEGGAYLVALNKTTGAVVFVQDSSPQALNAANLTLVTIGHAFLDDMAHGVLSTLSPTTGDVTNANAKALLDAHIIAGDGRANENIGLTSIHEVFHAEHNRVLAQIKELVTGVDANGNPVLDENNNPVGPRADAVAWTDEEYFQAAKLVTEMEYQHIVFGEFTRKLSPNINAFAGYDVTIDAAISAEFAHAVYRFGHSMLADDVQIEGYDPLTGIANGVDKSMGLIQAFLNPTAFDHTTAGEVSLGMAKQVGYGIDEWVTGALRNNLVGLPLDLATLNIVRGRDSGIGTLNEVRAQLFQQTGMSGLKPYGSWDEFGANLVHPESLMNFIAAYARDTILTEFGQAARTASGANAQNLSDWNTLQTANPTQYGTALLAAATAALNDANFMTNNQDFNAIDLWLGGLAEAKVPGGMLGSTFDFIFAMQMLHLQNGDRFYYLERLAGTNLLAEIEGQLLSDVVMRNLGVNHMYSDIFTVADSHLEMSTRTVGEYGTYSALSRATLQVVDAYGTTRTINKAGYAGDVFYGNSGDYLDSRGVFNPNGRANASEVIGGTAGADKIFALGGNDTVWGDGGNDTIDGGNGSDFLHGGDGADTIRDTTGDDLVWGDAGDDDINAGDGIDQVFGGDGNDLARGGLGADVIDGAAGDDILYGDNGSIVAGVMDSTGDADVIAGGDGNDVLYGGGGGDDLDGGEGNDVLVGGIGVDGLAGWLGDDLFVMDASDVGFNNAIDGGLGFDVVDYSASLGGGRTAAGRTMGVAVNLSNAGAGVAPLGLQVPDSFLAVEAVIGSRFDDILIGGTALVLDINGIPVPLLDGNGVPVPLVDALGVPILDPVTGAPLFLTVNNDWRIEGGEGNDLLEGGPANDILNGGAGSDTVNYLTTPPVVTIVNAEAVATGVTVNLGTATAQNTVAAGVDTLISIENVIGTDFDDTITGNGADNTIEGALGTNILNGGAGNDTASYVRSGLGVTVSLAVGGAQTTFIGGAVDTLTNFENLLGSAFADNLTGNGNNNVIEGGAGNDVLNGAGGVDTVSYQSAASRVVVNLNTTTGQNTLGAGTDTLTNFENVTGSAFADQLTGTGANNVIDGGGGDDTMTGQGGNDTYIVDSVRDRVVEAGGGGTDTVQTSLAAVSLVSYTNVENLSFVGTGNFAGTGNAGDNQISGGAGDDVLNGAGGNDAMTGGAGNDTYFVAQAGDTVVENANQGTDTIITGLTTFSLANLANIENLTFTATTAVTGTGNAASNVITSRGGNDTLNGGAGDDVLSGDGGDDTYIVDSVNDQVIELASSGTDTVLTTATTYSLTSMTEVENLTYTGTGNFSGTGNDANNAIVGGTGADALFGNAGNDFLNGGSGADNLYGGTGNDVYVVDNTGDIINEFAASGDADTIWTTLSAFNMQSLANIEHMYFQGVGNFNGVGNALGNIISGGAGNDILNGGLGWDILVGNGGADTFVFDTNIGSTVDTLSAFDATLDTIELNNSVFTGLGITGTLSATAFQTGTTATANSATVRIVYNTSDGKLYYDADGSGSGQAVYFAALTSVNGAVQAGNFVVTAPGGGGGNTPNNPNASNTITGGANADTLTGTAGDDLINGNGGADTLIGLGGNDQLIGGTGNDLMRGGLGNDVYSVDSTLDVVTELANEGNDTVRTTLGTYNLGNVANVENVTFDGFGNFVGTGNALANILTGGNGNDTLNGVGGPDSLIGGAGDDLYIVNNVGDTVTENANGGTDTIQTSVQVYSLAAMANVENLSYTGNLGFSGTGNAAANTLRGGVGNDTLDGGAGADNLIGGTGNDVYVVDQAGDVVTENAASGTDTIRTTLTTFSLANVVNIENLTYVGAAVFTGTGDANANVISGGSGNDNLTGAGGDDRLNGGTGNDAMAGGGGNDTFVVDSIGDAVAENANAGTDTIETTLSAYSIANAANVENLTFTGTGAFSGVGNAAANTIRGGADFDTLNGGAGADIMIGGNGGDLYYVDNAGDVVNELAGGGLDTIIVTLNNFSLANLGNVEQLLFGGQGNFTGTGNAGANLIGGGAGSDSISGGGGNDRIGGGLGADTLNGGAGSDTFFFNTALGNGNADAITDFSVVDDTIELSRAIFNGFQATGAVQANQFELGVNAASNGNTRLFVNNGGSLFYDADGSGVSVAVQIATLTVTGTLTAADFTVVA